MDLISAYRKKEKTTNIIRELKDIKLKIAEDGG
jgi:hypothetical protein